MEGKECDTIRERAGGVSQGPLISEDHSANLANLMAWTDVIAAMLLSLSVF